MKPMLVSCLIFAFFTAMGQKVRPVLHLAAGKVYTLESNGTSTSVKSFGGREAKVVTTTSFSLSFTVTGLKDSVYSLRGEYRSIYLKTKLLDTTFEMRSGITSPSDTASAIMSAIVNKPFAVRIALSGNVKAIVGLDSIIKSALAGFPSIDSAKKRKITAQLTDWFGTAPLKGLLENGTALFPSAPIAKNDRWQKSSAISLPSFANVSTGYQLVDESGDNYVVNGQGIITYQGDVKPDELNGATAKYDADGSTLSVIKINKSSGWLSDLTYKQLLEGKIDIADGPKTPGGMSIPFMYTADIVVTGK